MEHSLFSRFTRSIRPVPSTALVVALICAAPAPAFAGTWGSTQHGGRATGQAGAFVARADDAAALAYNPAGLAALDGFQATIGADYMDTDRGVRSSQGQFDSDDDTTRPVAYLSYRLPVLGERIALGLGYDSPWWSSVAWNDPANGVRFVVGENAVEMEQVRAALAVRLSERWSVGAAVRRIEGDFRYGAHFDGAIGFEPDDLRPFEVAVTGIGDEEVTAWDLGVRYAAPSWGLGAVYRDGTTLETTDPAGANVVFVGFPELAGFLEGNYGSLVATQSYERPSEVAVGAWYAPTPALRLELDVVHARWEGTDSRLFRGFSTPSNPDPAGRTRLISTRDWDDALSVRLGAEWELGERWLLYGGAAHEPSPERGDEANPAFPAGDAVVYAAGVGFELPWLTIDAGASYWDYDDRSTPIYFGAPPPTHHSFETSELVASLSARFRF